MPIPETPIGLLFLFFVIGAIMGSFGNVLILRVPRGWTIIGRSHCIHCQRSLQPWELIPIASFFLLRGRCGGCHKPISIQYPLIEIASGIIFVLALAHTGFSLLPAALLALSLWILLLITVVDAKTLFIPDVFNIPFVIFSIIYAFTTSSFDLYAVLLGGGFFFLQWLASWGRWMGSGDLFIGAGAGALLGQWPLVLVFLFVSYIAGGLMASFLLVFRRRTVEDSLAFGPFLGLGAVASLSLGPSILSLFN